MYPEGHRARCELRLNVRRIEQGGGGVVDQYPPQAEVHEVVPLVVPGRTIGVHARLEGSIRVPPVCDEVRLRVYETAGTPPQGWQLHGIGWDWKRHNSIYDPGRTAQRGCLLPHALCTTLCPTRCISPAPSLAFPLSLPVPVGAPRLPPPWCPVWGCLVCGGGGLVVWGGGDASTGP